MYAQPEMHFDEGQRAFREDLILCHRPSGRARGLRAKIEDTRSVVLHIRDGYSTAHGWTLLCACYFRPVVSAVSDLVGGAFSPKGRK